MEALFPGKKKAHKHKLSAQVSFGTNPGFLLILHSGSPVRLRDKPSSSPDKSGVEGLQKTFMW